jgi:hypothetical protein
VLSVDGLRNQRNNRQLAAQARAVPV